MSRINFVDTVVGELCASMGLPAQPLNDRGWLRLRFDDTPVVLSYSDQPLEMLWLQVELGEIPEEADAARFLLRAGFDCWCRNQMTIALDPSERQAFGYTCLPVSALTVELLDQALKQMLEVALPLRERIQHGAFDLPVEDSAPHEGSGDDAGIEGVLRA